MPRVETTPFRRPKAFRVTAGPWQMVEPDRSALPDVIPTWDYATPLELTRAMQIDFDEIRADTASGDLLTLDWVATVASSTTRVRRCIARVPATASPVQINTTLPTHELGGVITIDTSLVVRSPDPRTDLAPHRPGSVLWTDTRSCILEADVARFPVEVVDFEGAGLPTEAAWRIMIDDEDLEAPSPACVRVLINRSHPGASQMATDPSGDNESSVLASALEFETARAMVLAVIRNDDVHEEARFPSGSLGETLLFMLDVHFPRESADTLRMAYLQDPGKVDLDLQSSLRVFRTEP